MLRIQIEEEQEVVRFRLEGKLVQPWVDELVQVWLELVTRHLQAKFFSVDLSEVSFVDLQGKALLGSMLKAGCTIEGSTPFISAVIEDLRSSAEN